MVQRPADIGEDHTPGVIRFGWNPGNAKGKRVAGIEGALAVVVTDAAADFVGAGLGKDLDAAEAQAVELGGEGVRVDADFADGFFGRKLAAGETVDVDRAAVRTGA